MQVTIFSFLSALLWSSLLIVAIYLLRHTRFKQHFGVLSMVLLYLFCAVRLFLPLEFPHTLIAADGVIYPHIYNLLTRERDMLANKPLVLILCAAWLLGFCELLFRYIRQYRKAICSVALTLHLGTSAPTPCWSKSGGRPGANSGCRAALRGISNPRSAWACCTSESSCRTGTTPKLNYAMCCYTNTRIFSTTIPL